jgi:hypothetical protein
MYLFVIVAGNEDTPIFEQELRYRWILVYAYPRIYLKDHRRTRPFRPAFLVLDLWPQAPVAVVDTHFGERTLLIVMCPPCVHARIQSKPYSDRKVCAMLRGVADFEADFVLPCREVLLGYLLLPFPYTPLPLKCRTQRRLSENKSTETCCDTQEKFSTCARVLTVLIFFH